MGPDAETRDAGKEPENGHSEVVSGQSPDLAETGSSRGRAAAAWWFVFLGPVVVAVATLIAGLAGEASDVQLTFVIAVWTATLVIGLVAAPRMTDNWWIAPFVVAFAAAAAAAGLLYLTQVTIPVEDTAATTTATTTTTVMPTSTVATPGS